MTAATMVGLAPAPARAQDSSSSMAEQLFMEGKALMQQKDYARACAKLKASHDLDRTATGTLLNLAVCHELLGKPATAWAEFRQAAAESLDRREDRVKLAREHEAKLFPILSRIRIFVPPDARAPGLTLELDRTQAVAEASWGIELPIDPGKHVLEASAPGHRPEVVEFVVGDVSDRQTVAVEPLEILPPDPIADAQRDAAERDHLAALQTRRVVGFVVGGVGLAAVGAGLGFGLLASSKNSDAKSACPNDVCDSGNTQGRAESSLSSARTFATVSNVTVAAGALIVASGLVIVLSARPDKASDPSAASPAAWRIAPAPIASGGALFLTGDL